LLLDVWLTRPNEPETWQIRANCPFCGDGTFVETIRGGFCAGPYGTNKLDDDTDDVPSTVVLDIQERNNVYYYLLAKASPDAKPQRKHP